MPEPRSPHTSETDRAQPVYYAMDVTRASLPEIWRIAGSNPIGFALVLFAKFLRKPLRGNIGIAHDSLEFLDLNDVPEPVMTAIAPTCRDCETLGFRPQFAHRVAVLGNAETYAITSTNSTGNIACQMIYVRHGTLTETPVVFVSYLDDGRLLTTTNGRKRFRLPPNASVLYRPGATVAQLLDLQERRLANLTTAGPRRLDGRQLQDAIADFAAQSARFHEKRGVYLPLTQDEVTRLRAVSESQGR